MSNRKPVFDYKTCMACSACVSACPFSCLDITITNLDRYKKAYPSLVNDSSCTGCGLCSKTCPVDAIEIKG